MSTYLSILLSISDRALRLILRQTSFLPHLSLSFNALTVRLQAWFVGAPNFDTPFSEIDGIEAGRVKWFIEAEDRQPEDPVLLYAHGGGYSLGVFPPMARMLLSIWKKVGNRRLSILWVDYPLVYEGRFPQQLKCMVGTYNKLQETCSRIILLGDSAGAHLFCIMLRHGAIEPFDSVEPLKGIEKLVSGVFVSPWVDLNTVKPFGEMFEPDSVKRNAPEMNPYKDPINWNKILPPTTLVTLGEDEELRPAIEQWIKLSKLDSDSVYMEAKGGHDSLAKYADYSPIMEIVVDFLRLINTSNLVKM